MVLKTSRLTRYLNTPKTDYTVTLGIIQERVGNMKQLLRQIPNVNILIKEMTANYAITNEIILKESINEILEELRAKILTAEAVDFSMTQLIEEINLRYQIKNLPKHRRCINGTGVIIHTNLGRSPLSAKQLANIEVLKSYNNLEFDCKTQKRGSRYEIVEDIICKVCHCEAALVVNNNAAAVMLILNEFAQNKEVIVSNSELIEIGGSFRIPEIIKLAGAKMRNVGTTNKTKLEDYYEALSAETGLLAKIHQSNFYIEGFVASVSTKKLVNYRNEHNLDVIIYEDLASGAIFDFSKYGLDKEPTVIESVAAGVDLISFSGDKLLGSVQAGIIVGKKIYLDRLKKNQLLRVVRPSGIILNIIESTFNNYLSETLARANIPTFAHLVEDSEQARLRAQFIYDLVKDKIACEVIATTAVVGGGCMPKTKLKSYGVKFSSIDSAKMKQFLAGCALPIIPIIVADALVIDCKVITTAELAYIVEKINEFVNNFS